MNEIEQFGSNEGKQGLFRKYGFSRVLLNTVIIDANACISKSTLVFIIGLIVFDLKWIK